MTTGSVIAVFFGLLGLALWMVPSMIAFGRKHSKRKAILLVNLLLSWTIFGWFFALGWALRGWEDTAAEHQPEALKTKASVVGA